MPEPLALVRDQLIEIASLSLDALIEQGTPLTEAQYAAALEMAAQHIIAGTHSPSAFPHIVRAIIESFGGKR